MTDFPTDREELLESLNELIKLKERSAGSVTLAEEKGLKSLMLGSGIEDRLKTVAVILVRTVDAWQLELNNRFPELFSGIDEMIGSIKPGVLPAMEPKTLELASRAISKKAESADINDWARQLTEDFLLKHD